MLLQEQIQYRPIADVTNSSCIHSLLLTFILLIFKHVLIEIVLQLFISQVNTHLLEAIPFKVFKAEYIEYSYLHRVVIHLLNGRQEMVDAIHDPTKHSLVESLG